jgi:uncharacterized integral membrane protein
VKEGSVIRLIVGVVILILLGVLFALNGKNEAAVNLFGYQMENVPIIAVAIAGFVLGVLYSFILYFMRFVARRRRASLQDRDRAVRDRERTVQDREKQLETLAEGMQETRAAAQGPAGQDTGEQPAVKRRRARRP